MDKRSAREDGAVLAEDELPLVGAERRIIVGWAMGPAVGGQHEQVTMACEVFDLIMPIRKPAGAAATTRARTPTDARIKRM